MDLNVMLAAMLFGTIGLGLFMHGKKAERVPHLAAGLALMVVPYMIHGIVLLLVVGTVLTVSPFLVERS